MSKAPLKIGVTGSIGMGKSTIVQEFSKHNVLTWNSDQVVHLLYKKGNRGYDIVKNLAPEAAITDRINREILSTIIIKSPLILETLEKLIHPLVEMDRLDFISNNNTEKVIVFDIPLLFETSCDKWLDFIIVATAPFSVQKKRVLSRKSMTEEKFLYLLSKQCNIEYLRRKADIIVDTNVNIEELSKEIEKILKEISRNYD